MNEETQALSTFISEKHVGIADEFVARVVSLLGQDRKKIMRYGIEESYRCENESIVLSVQPGVAVTITLSRSM